eukprot:TRINITY_DN4157_c0_g1_i1.p2 TRINITY_DN4157_c0_g1~~TRINITY_DN4157_c0_g1_i1.p2  ORF type:complete len:130 (-),score=20.58 TRINITY_DN4157_c0_g1_i1:63-452(-)
MNVVLSQWGSKPITIIFEELVMYTTGIHCDIFSYDETASEFFKLVGMAFNYPKPVVLTNLSLIRFTIANEERRNTLKNVLYDVFGDPSVFTKVNRSMLLDTIQLVVLDKLGDQVKIIKEWEVPVELSTI